MSSPYRLVASASTADDFHARVVPEPASCEIWLHEVIGAALVLGSTQDPSIVDRDACERAGVEVVRRRSGGGAVLLVPGAVTWVDVIVPRGSPGWSDDVHGPMVWLGEHLAAVVADRVPEASVDVHRGPMVTTAWSPQVCFDGLGAGEVLVDGAKLVGISQRRTRHAARLQCCWYSSYEAADLVDLLSAHQRPAVAALRPVATLPPVVAAALPGALVARL